MRDTVRGWLLFLLLLAAVGEVSEPAAAGKRSVRLRYRLRPGASYEATLQVSFAVQVEAEGASGQAAAMAQGMGKDVEQEMTMNMAFVVGKATADGSMPVDVQVEDAHVETSMGGQAFEIQGLKENLEGVSVLRGRLSPGGRALELGVQNVEGLPQGSRDMMDRVLQAMPSFPDGKMRVGDSFEVPVKFDAPGLRKGGTIEAKATCTYTLRSVSRREAVFDVRSRLSAGAGGEIPEKMNLTGGSLGTAVFDRKEGIFTSMRSDTTLDLAMEIALPGEDQQSVAEVPTLKVKASAKGPLQFTMTRVTTPASRSPEAPPRR